MNETGNNNNIPDDAQESFDFRHLASLCLSHWRWYVATVSVTLLIALFYAKMTQPTYKREASVMVLDGNQESSALSKLLDDISDMGFAFSEKSNVNNVIAAIQSPDVMTEVVKKLGIDVTYTSPGTFYDATLYGHSLPVTVEFHDVEYDETASISLKLLDNGNVEMSGFTKNGDAADSEPLTCHVGQTVHTPIGIVSIKPTKYFDDAQKNRHINVRKSDLNSATGHFLHGLTVEQAGKNSTILNLSYTDVSTKRAEDILSAVIDIYNDVWVKNRSRVSDSTSKFIDERLAKIERELGLVDTDIANYKSKNLVPDVEMAYTLSMERADKNSAILLDLNTRLSVAKYIRGYIVDKANTNQLIPVDLGLDNDKIDEQIRTFNDLQLERNKIITNSSKQNPLVADMDKSLAQIRRAIIYSMDNMIMSLSTRISHLQNDEQKTNTNISANPTQEKFLLSVERQQKVKEALYLFLLQKREENDLAKSFTANNTQVIKSPTGSNKPISPRTPIILLIGLVAGLALPTGVIYLLEACNTTIRNRKDIEGNVTMPLLGEIPYAGNENSGMWQLRATLGVNDSGTKDCSVVVEAGNHDAANEAFRILRTNFGFMYSHTKSCSVTMFTSLDSGVGKTFLTMNMGLCMALQGRRVLVIDGDLRKASLSSFVGKPHKGLSSYLGGTTDSAAELTHHYPKCGGLDILPAGNIPQNPSELLSNDRLTKLFEEMKQLYDYILVDCPPVNKFADTSLISTCADNTVFVVRAGLTQRAATTDIERIYLSSRLKNMSLVVNGVLLRNGHNDGRQAYGQAFQ